MLILSGTKIKHGQPLSKLAMELPRLRKNFESNIFSWILWLINIYTQEFNNIIIPYFNAKDCAPNKGNFFKTFISLSLAFLPLPSLLFFRFHFFSLVAKFDQHSPTTPYDQIAKISSYSQLIVALR